MKQTAVEWFVEELKKLAYDKNHHLGLGDIRITQGMLDDYCQQAKAMEKEQIIKAVYDSMGTNFDPNFGRAEQYYNETYRDNLSPRK